jgi:hypothetical protein
MFNYIGFKNKMFYEAVEAKLNGELKGVILLAEDKVKYTNSLYAIIFIDESGYRRSLWMPVTVIHGNNPQLETKIKDSELYRVSRKWHDAFTKIEEMVFCGKLFYYPEDYLSWKKTKERSVL